MKMTEVKVTLRTACPNCDEQDTGRNRVWYFVKNGVAVGACFNCECIFTWDEP